MEIYRRSINNSPLGLWCAFFLETSDWSGAVLWQLNHGSYGTFDFVFVMNLVIGLAVVIVCGAKGHMNSAVTFVLHRVGSDDCAKCCGFLWGDRCDNLNLFWFFFIVIFLVVTNGRQGWDWVMNNQSTFLIFLIFYVENLNLFLLLLSWYNWLGWRKSFIVVLDDDFDDGL